MQITGCEYNFLKNSQRPLWDYKSLSDQNTPFQLIRLDFESAPSFAQKQQTKKTLPTILVLPLGRIRSFLGREREIRKPHADIDKNKKNGVGEEVSFREAVIIRMYWSGKWYGINKHILFNNVCLVDERIKDGLAEVMGDHPVDTLPVDPHPAVHRDDLHGRHVWTGGPHISLQSILQVTSYKSIFQWLATKICWCGLY